VTTTT
jgi:hypothetical protein